MMIDARHIGTLKPKPDETERRSFSCGFARVASANQFELAIRKRDFRASGL
jgi:hypothetical protein